MNYGRYFEFDFESSYLQKGIAVFNYRWLKILDGSDKKTPRYPVYLTFTPESFSFNLHYLKDKKKDDENIQDDRLSHYHNAIIEVRLAPNVDEAKGLTESFNNAYIAQFPLKTKDNQGERITTVDVDLLNLIYDSFDAQDCPVGGYSQLDCFEPEVQQDYELTHNSTPHLLRKIILDFLFDLEFTNVFKNVAFYDEFSARLKENFLFNALLNKTRYYYYRTELCAKEAVERCLMAGEEDEDKCDQSLKFFFEQYAKAEHDWVKSIIDKRAMKAFHESPWFDEAYQELEQVYFANRAGRWRKQGGDMTIKSVQPIKRIREIGSVERPSRKKTARRYYLKRIDAVNDSFKLTVSNVLNLMRKKSPEFWNSKKRGTFGRAVSIHGDTAKNAAAWEVGHYHFIGLWKLWFGDVPTFLYSLLLIIPVLLAAFFVFHTLHDKSASIASIDYNGWIFLFTAGSLFVFLIAMSAVIRRHFRSTWGGGGMALMMPRLLAAVTTAWFTMMMSVDTIQVFLDNKNLDQLHWPAVIILASMTLLFEIYESRQKNPFDRWYEWLVSSLIVFIIAYIYSLVVGCLTYDFFGTSTIVSLEQQQTDCESDLNKTNQLYFLIQFSSFATFIGIFLQLMFQGKSVADTE